VRGVLEPRELARALELLELALVPDSPGSHSGQAWALLREVPQAPPGLL